MHGHIRPIRINFIYDNKIIFSTHCGCVHRRTERPLLLHGRLAREMGNLNSVLCLLQKIKTTFHERELSHDSPIIYARQIPYMSIILYSWSQAKGGVHLSLCVKVSVLTSSIASIWSPGHINDCEFITSHDLGNYHDQNQILGISLQYLHPPTFPCTHLHVPVHISPTHRLGVSDTYKVLGQEIGYKLKLKGPQMSHGSSYVIIAKATPIQHEGSVLGPTALINILRGN